MDEEEFNVIANKKKSTDYYTLPAETLPHGKFWKVLRCMSSIIHLRVSAVAFL